jgi:hypothetical protein
MLSWPRMRAERCVIWFAWRMVQRADAFLQGSAASSASSMNFPRFRVPAREQWSLGTVCATHNFETLSFQALSFQALPCQALPRSLGFFVFAILVASLAISCATSQ